MRRLALVAVLLLVGTSACTVESSGSGTPSDTPDDAVDLLHDTGLAAKAIRAIEKKVGATPAQLVEADVYPEYLIVEAQDPPTPDHIDRYEWRDDDVSEPEPVQLSGPQEDVDASLFPTATVKWAELAEFVRVAERRALHAKPIRIEDPNASYVSITRSTSSQDDGRITIRISVNGPRRSGSVTMTTSGDVIEVSVS